MSDLARRAVAAEVEDDNEENGAVVADDEDDDVDDDEEHIRDLARRAVAAALEAGEDDDEELDSDSALRPVAAADVEDDDAEDETHDHEPYDWAAVDGLQVSRFEGSALLQNLMRVSVSCIVDKINERCKFKNFGVCRTCGMRWRGRRA